MRTKRAQRYFFAMAFLTAVLSVGFYFLLYLPQQAELCEKEAEAASLGQEIEEVKAFRRVHSDPVGEAKDFGRRQQIADGMIPPRLELGAFLTETEKYASSTGTALLGALPGTPETWEGFAREKVRFTVRGDYFALLDFLYLLEQSGRFVKIEAVRGKSDNVGVFTGTIDLWIYAKAQ